MSARHKRERKARLQRIAEIHDRLSAIMPRPWSSCGAHYDKPTGCPCNLIWSKPADTPIATVLTHESDGMLGEGPTREASYRNLRFIAHAPDDVAWLLEQLARKARYTLSERGAILAAPETTRPEGREGWRAR